MPLHQLNKENLSVFIIKEAERLGFDECGISPVSFLKEDAARVEQWINSGFHAEMQYMERNREKRYDPSLLVENAKSVISVLYNYYPSEILPEPHNFIISKYAYGKDYHYVMKEKLFQLLQTIEEKTGNRIARVFVDSAPVLERSWAAKSGLGFIGKNTLLINRKRGSFFFLGQIILDLDLNYNPLSDTKNYCGHCTACIDACPTEALKPFEVDANKCISYLTIEHKGELPENLKGKFKDRIFGCDICQDVCPWNIKFARPHHEPAFLPKPELKTMTKEKWKSLDKTTFKRLFKGTALERTGYKNLMRNIRFVSEENKENNGER